MSLCLHSISCTCPLYIVFFFFLRVLVWWWLVWVLPRTLQPVHVSYVLCLVYTYYYYSSCVILCLLPVPSCFILCGVSPSVSVVPFLLAYMCVSQLPTTVHTCPHPLLSLPTHTLPPFGLPAAGFACTFLNFGAGQEGLSLGTPPFLLGLSSQFAFEFWRLIELPHGPYNSICLFCFLPCLLVFAFMPLSPP